MRFCELKEKDVINRCDCKKLGQICDLVIDECSGQICSIIVPGPPKTVWSSLSGSGIYHSLELYLSDRS